MIGFVIGSILGGTVGVVTICCCQAASEADRRLK